MRSGGHVPWREGSLEGYDQLRLPLKNHRAPLKENKRDDLRTLFQLPQLLEFARRVLGGMKPASI